MQSEKNASGRYSNPQFGITDIIFQQGWHGTHIPSLIGLVVFMHAGNQRELAGNPFGQGKPTPSRPQIMLQIINNSALAKIDSMSTKLKGGLSIFKNCKQLARNLTSMISGKTFNVITVECHLSSLMGSQGAAATTSIQSNFGNRSNNNILSLMSKSIIANGMMQTKPFEYNGSDRTYRLAIVVNNQLFSTNSNSTPQKKQT
ncbi:MAG: hypothetical protein WCF06_15945 [Nitrososphaeraceae archaeon]